MNRFPTLTDIKNSKCAHLNKELCEEKPVKKSKYRNQKVEIDGFKFDSLKESRRYIALRQLQTIGEISDLKLQVPFQLSSCKYIADFTYSLKDGTYCVEDVKSSYTKRLAVYRMKKKMMLQEKGILIKET